MKATTTAELPTGVYVVTADIELLCSLFRQDTTVHRKHLELTANNVFFQHIRVFAKVGFSKCTSLKIVPKAALAVHFKKKGKNVLYRR